MVIRKLKPYHYDQKRVDRRIRKQYEKNPNIKEGELKLFRFLPIHMNIGSFLVKLKSYIRAFLLLQFNGQVVHTVYLCLPRAVRQMESLNGRQVGLIMTQRTTITRTSGRTSSTCLGTFPRMVFSRSSA